MNVTDRYDLQSHINSLPEQYKDMIIDFYYKKLKISEISFVRGIPEGTVKRRLHDAKKKMRNRMEGNNE